MSAEAASGAIASVFRDEAGQVVGALVRATGDFALAEDAVQDAIVEALRRWPQAGVPERPGAWLMAAARRKAIDRLRREARLARKVELLGRLEAGGGFAAPGEEARQVIDDRLVLIFTCCHPALSREAQIALTLRSVVGLTTAQIARAFLAAEPAVAQRIVRAKRKIVGAGIPFRVPSRDELASRLGEVLAVVYLAFNEGYLSTAGSSPDRPDLAADAEWLASLLLVLLPDEPEVKGLLVLIRLAQARRRARFDKAGRLVLLERQDRSLWDRPAIEAGAAMLTTALAARRPGPYQVQAAIAACHATSPSWEATDWRQILAFYDVLARMDRSPVVALNRAIARSRVEGPAAALAEVEGLGDALDGYHLFHATRAELLRGLGRPEEARRADEAALRLTSNPAEVELLRSRIGSSAPG